MVIIKQKLLNNDFLQFVDFFKAFCVIINDRTAEEWIGCGGERGGRTSGVVIFQSALRIPTSNPPAMRTIQ